MSLTKKIVIIAGPNGAGKTTFAREFLPREGNCAVFVNADLIAAGLSPFAPETMAIKAGKLMLEAITKNAQSGVNFSIETTLSGLGYSRMIPAWRSLGYKVKLIFLELPNIQTAISRVSERVKQGGHNIPSETIERRFIAGSRNFHEIYKPLVDTWLHFDNAGSTPNLLDWSEK